MFAQRLAGHSVARITLRYLNRFGEALPHLEQSLAIHQEIGDPFSTSITQITLA
jgi:hypothetical protein